MGVTIEDLAARLDHLEVVALVGAKNVLDMDEAAIYTGYTRAHLYALTSGRGIPHYKKGRKLYFRKDELDAWMTEDRVRTAEDVDRDASAYVRLRRLGGR